MKKILSLLGTITLIVISTKSLVACNKQYSEDELKKKKNIKKYKYKWKYFRMNITTRKSV